MKLRDSPHQPACSAPSRTCELGGLCRAARRLNPALVEWNYGQYEGLTSVRFAPRHRNGTCSATAVRGANRPRRSAGAPTAWSRACGCLPGSDPALLERPHHAGHCGALARTGGRGDGGTSAPGYRKPERLELRAHDWRNPQSSLWNDTRHLNNVISCMAEAPRT